MSKYFLKNGECRELYFRAWKWAKDGITKIYPKFAKAFRMDKAVDCHFCNSCNEQQ